MSFKIGEKEYKDDAIIPDGEILYKYVNPQAIPEDQDQLGIGIFDAKHMSCDWEKHQPNPEKSFHIEEGKTIIVSINVCDEIRNPRNPKNKGKIEPKWEQKIVHDPVSKEDDPKHGQNYSHSLISGKKRAAVQNAIIKNSTYRKVTT